MEYPLPPVTTRQVSVSEASRELGISPETVRRWIKSGRLQADRAIRPQGTVWLITLPVTTPRGVLPVTAVSTPHAVEGQEPDQDSVHDRTSIPSNEACYPSPPVTDHAGDPAPLVASIARLIAELAEVRVVADRRADHLVGMAERLAELARENGRLTAELDAAQGQIQLLTASSAAQSVEPTSGPSTWRSWTADHAREAVVGFMAVLVLVFGLVALLR